MFKKRFDGKPLAMLSTLLMAVCLSMFAASREGEWALNPSDFRYDMSLYFTVGPEQFADAEKYEIGAFVGDECRGTARLLDLPDGGSCLYMRIRSNASSGEEVEFLMRDRATSQTYVLKDKTGSLFSFESDGIVGLPSKPYEMTPWFTVNVEAGENGTVKADNGSYAWGSEIEIEATAAEGYHFLGWSDGYTDNPRSITVESDVNLTAAFEVSSYNLTFELDGQLYELKTLNYGETVVLPEVPEVEGYSFTGWGDAPETMPAHEVTLTGSYKINSYKLQLVLDGEVYQEYETEYGTPLKREDFDGSTPPEREGYTFSGWGEVPETMPARDLELIGTYNVNSYLLTLMLNGEVYEVMTVEYGAPLNLPTPPEQEGQSWDGWDDAPETMPAHDLILTGDYEFNGYQLTLIVDGELYELKTILYGDPIELPEMPEREGYTFSGWSDAPAKMPARNVEVTGDYNVNYYKLTFRIAGKVYKEEELAYGTEIVVEDPQVPEGFTFSGWGEVLKTMPAHDVEYDGAYIVNTYTLTLMLNDEVYEILTLDYGSDITLPEMPEREGYTFSGWSEAPLQMPARDVTVTGEYTINYYVLTIYIDNEVYSTSLLAYGETIVLPEPEAPEGKDFKGWEGEIPQAMPAHNVDIYGTFGVSVGVSSVGAEAADSFDVIGLDGTVILRGVKTPADLEGLAPGIYVVGGRKVVVK